MIQKKKRLSVGRLLIYNAAAALVTLATMFANGVFSPKADAAASGSASAAVSVSQSAVE